MHATRPVLSPRLAALRILAVGDLVPENGFEMLLEVLSELSCSQPHARLIVVGEGPERAGLERSIQRLGLSERVGLPGALDIPRFAELLQRAHVCYLPEARPSAPVPAALPLALDSGLCVVGTVTGVAARFLRDGETGLLVEAGDQAALLRALGLVLDNGDLRRSLGERAALASRRRSA